MIAREKNVILQWQMGPGMKVCWGPADAFHRVVKQIEPREEIVEIRAIYVGDDPGPSTLMLVRNKDDSSAMFRMIGAGIEYAYAMAHADEDFLRIHGDREAWDAFEETEVEP